MEMQKVPDQIAEAFKNHPGMETRKFVQDPESGDWSEVTKDGLSSAEKRVIFMFVGIVLMGLGVGLLSSNLPIRWLGYALAPAGLALSILRGL